MGKGILEQGTYTVSTPYDFSLSASNDSPTLFSSNELGIKEGIIRTVKQKSSGYTTDPIEYFLTSTGLMPRVNRKYLIPEIKKVIYDTPNNTTIVYFKDGTKEIARVMDGDKFDKEVGIMQCIVKKMYGCRSKWLKEVVNKGIEVKSKK